LRVEKEQTPKVKARLKKQLEPKVREELATKITAEQRRDTYLKYALCAGAGCVLGGAAVWAYNAFASPAKPASK